MATKPIAPTGPARLAPAMPGDIEARIRRQAAHSAKVAAEQAMEGETPMTAEEFFQEASAGMLTQSKSKEDRIADAKAKADAEKK